MSDSYLIAHNILLEPYGTTERQLQEILQMASGASIDIADVFLQYRHYEYWTLEEGIVKNCDFTIDKGAGIRSISGVKTGFAYINDLSFPALEKAAKKARSISSLGSQGCIGILKKPDIHQLYPNFDPLLSFTEEDKIKLLQEVNAEAHRQDNRIEQVIVNLMGSYEVILIISNDDVITADVRPLVSLQVIVTAKNGIRYEKGTFSGSGRNDYNFFLNENRGLYYAREAARSALLNLEAINAPAGTMPVVLASGCPGVLLHEAIGHGLEGDFIRKGSSVFAGKIGEKIAGSECTVVDNGSLSGNMRGSINIDDEGTSTQNTILIENGILRGFMYDKLNARLTGNKSTGNGRRQSYSHIPLPRMTNTYMLAGKHPKEEIISSVKEGIYAVNFSGGEVDITSGKFVFSTSEAYLIKNGKISYPIKGATLIGDGPTILTKVSMVGNDLQMDYGAGTCVKEGQSEPVGIGQPTLKIDELIVGGTSTVKN